MFAWYLEVAFNFLFASRTHSPSSIHSKCSAPERVGRKSEGEFVTSQLFSRDRAKGMCRRAGTEICGHKKHQQEQDREGASVLKVMPVKCR